MKIIVKNGKGRPVNLGKFYSPQWASFESTVQWHDCPEATEDGEYTAELLWQIKINDQWYFSVEPTADAGSRYRKVWRIVPQPQESPRDLMVKFMNLGDENIKSIMDEFNNAEGEGPTVIEYFDNFGGPQKEEAKTMECKTDEILYMEGRQPFELYPNLAEHLQNAACHWKVDMSTWTSLLEEINIVCSQNTTLMEENARYKRALEHVRVFSAEEIIRNIATEALKPKP